MSIQIIFTTSTGNTEHVVGVIRKHLEGQGVQVSTQLAEEASAEDLLKGDILILASGTWNTGGSEGQLHVRMDNFLRNTAKGIDLKGKRTAIISLGDERYYCTGRAAEHLIQFVKNHNGKLAGSPLIIIGDPEGQEGKIIKWSEGLVGTMQTI